MTTPFFSHQRTQPTPQHQRFLFSRNSNLTVQIPLLKTVVELVPTLMIDDAETKMRTNAAVRVELKHGYCHHKTPGCKTRDVFDFLFWILDFQCLFSLCCPIFVINLRSPCLLPCFFDFRSIIVIPSLQTVFFKTPLICIIAIVSITHLIVLDF
jgi:hypothetical protein